MIVEKHLIGQTVIVPYMEGTDSDILGLGLGFLITSSLIIIIIIKSIYKAPCLRVIKPAQRRCTKVHSIPE